VLQVDVFWVYGIGAMAATAAGRQLAELGKGKAGFGRATPFGSEYFAFLLLYLSLIFVPEALWLTWNFPHWETMQLVGGLEEIPAWGIVLAAAGDIAVAVLGYWVAYKLLSRGRFYAAHLQWMLGYFLFFFMLIHGWDGSGWQRFLYDPTVKGGALWTPGTHMDPLDFATSRVALTLYAMALPTLLPLVLWGHRWLREGYQLEKLPPEKAHRLATAGVGFYFAGVGVALLSAGLVTALIQGFSTLLWPPLSILLGLLVFFLLAYPLILRKGRPLHLAFRKYLRTD
jgi:hypothetical protein